MATVVACRDALEKTLARLSAAASSRADLDRTVACHITDLGVSFHSRLAGGRLNGVADGDDPSARIRLSVASDDLVALVNGELGIASAWAAGRLSVQASFSDLLLLRKLL